MCVVLAGVVLLALARTAEQVKLHNTVTFCLRPLDKASTGLALSPKFLAKRRFPS